MAKDTGQESPTRVIPSEELKIGTKNTREKSKPEQNQLYNLQL